MFKFVKFAAIATLFAFANADCPCSSHPLSVLERELLIQNGQSMVLDIMSNVYQNASQIMEIVGLKVEHVASDYYKVDELDKCFVATVKDLEVNIDGYIYKVDLRMKGEALDTGFRNSICECEQRGPFYKKKPSRYIRNVPGPHFPFFAHPPFNAYAGFHHGGFFPYPFNPYAYVANPYGFQPEGPAPVIASTSIQGVEAVDICKSVLCEGINKRLDDIKCSLEKNCYQYGYQYDA